MKKILVLMLALVMAFSVCAFAACGEKDTTYSGEYKYENPYAPGSGSYYGVKVDVKVKDDAITSVTVTSTDTATYTNLSESWANKQVWIDGQAAFLNSFVGKNPAEVFDVEVACQATGVPATITGMDYVAGATQSSGRVILAVQNALKDFAPADYAPTYVYAGEYKYENPYAPGSGSFYGVKVNVTVKNNVVTGVAVTSTDTATYTNLSESWVNKQVWIDGQAAFLNSFVGKTVAEVLAVEVGCQTTGVPATIAGMDYVAGATQSSGRVILAVQNALASLTNEAVGPVVTFSGEYKYENAWAPGNYYGVQVSVTVKGTTITGVTVTSTDTDAYTNLSASWADKQIWIDGQAAFLNSFVGKSVEEIFNVVVACQANGQPATVTGMDYVAGATQSSGRVILAVQNALASFAPDDYAPTYVYTGEYKYENAWVPGNFYGVQVAVTVKGNVITGVTVTSTDTDAYTNLSGSWTDKAIWENGQAAFLAKFAGMTVAEANAVVVACQENGQPTTVTGMDFVTGATQSSGRVILAIQNALSKIAA